MFCNSTMKREDTVIKKDEFYLKNIEKAKELFSKDSEAAMSLCLDIAKQCSVAENLRDVELTAYHTLLDFSSMLMNSKLLDKYAAIVIKKADAYGELRHKMNAYGKRGAYYWNICEYHKALKLFNIGYKIALQLNDEPRQSNFLRNIGLSHCKLGNFQEALKHQKKARLIALKHGQKEAIAYNEYWLAFTYASMDSFRKSLEHSFKAIELFKELKNEQGLCLTYNNIGLIYRDWDQNKKALDYFQKAMLKAEKLNDINSLADLSNNIGLIYRANNDIDLALEYYHKALEYRRKRNFIEKEAIILQNIANLYIEINQPDKAKNYTEKALKLRRKMNTPDQLLIGLYTYLKYLLKINDMDEAGSIVAEINENISLAQKSSILSEAYFACSTYYSQIKDFEKAYECLAKHTDLFKELFNEETRKQIDSIEKNYQQKTTRDKAKHKLKMEQLKVAVAMACTASHEINQPLMILQGTVDLLTSKHTQLLQDEADRNKIEHIYESINRVKTILQNLEGLEEIKISVEPDFYHIISLDKKKKKKISARKK